MKETCDLPGIFDENRIESSFPNPNREKTIVCPSGTRDRPLIDHEQKIDFCPVRLIKGIQDYYRLGQS